MSLRLPNSKATVNSCPVNANTFPGKLWKLVNDPQFKSINWGNCGTTLLINPDNFREEVLRCGQYSIFKTQNFSSFVRQLNLYGFRKLSSTPTKVSIENSSGSSRHPPHCFAHECFLKHRPDRLPHVRRTTNATRRRPSPQKSKLGYYYAGKNGTTFRIFGRCESNSTSPFRNQTEFAATSPSYFYTVAGVPAKQMASQEEMQSASTSDSGSGLKLNSDINLTFMGKKKALVKTAPRKKKPSHLNKSLQLSSPYSRYADSGVSDDDKASTPANLLQPSSANVLWGQGFVGPPSSEEDSPMPSPQLALIAKAEKGTTKAIRTPPEAVSFPSCLYDAHGRLQKFVVIQQSPTFGPGYSRTSRKSRRSPSMTMGFDSNGRQVLSPWSSLYSGQYMPPALESDPYYAYQQMVDYSAMQFPYGGGYMVPYPPEYMHLPSFAPPENMMQDMYAPVASYFNDNGMALNESPPIFDGGPNGNLLPPNTGRQQYHQTQPAPTSRNRRAPRDPSKPKAGCSGSGQSRKVVTVKQEMDSHQQLYSAMLEENGDGAKSPFSAPETHQEGDSGCGGDKQEE